MKGNIFYPIATTGIVAIVGYYLKTSGYDFEGIFSDKFLHTKELIFVLISYAIITAVIMWDIFKYVYGKRATKIQGEKNKLIDEIDNLKTQLMESNANLDTTKKELTALLDSKKELEFQGALKNYKEDNQL